MNNHPPIGLLFYMDIKYIPVESKEEKLRKIRKQKIINMLNESCNITDNTESFC